MATPRWDAHHRPTLPKRRLSREAMEGPAGPHPLDRPAGTHHDPRRPTDGRPPPTPPSPCSVGHRRAPASGSPDVEVVDLAQTRRGAQVKMIWPPAASS
jgi:hypothetical protein